LLDAGEIRRYGGGMSNHQAWLEAPYDHQARMDAAFEYWCEENGRDFDDDEALADFERFVEQYDTDL
jgi:hypothetical protein